MYKSKKDALSEIFSIEGIDAKLAASSFKVNVTAEKLIAAMSKHSYSLNTELSVSPATSVKLVRYLWPDKPHTNCKICGYLFEEYNLKYCANCREVKTLDMFSKNSSKDRGLNSHCKSCYLETTREYQKEYQRTRDSLKLSRVPSWADLDKIKDIYRNRPEGYHVDHIIPLQGKLVSGLHVENNLQYLIAEDNLIKGNKFDV